MRRTCAIPIVACLAAACTPAFAEDDGVFRDPQDGWVDASRFLDTAYGFVPLIAPITEPAVGYGATGALIFIDRHPPAPGQPPVRPNMAAVGGFATENGSQGLFAGHLGSWLGGRLQTEVAAMDSNLNLEFFGFGDAPESARNGLDYRITATGAVAGGKYRLGETRFWAGLRYGVARTEVKLKDDGFELPGVSTEDLDLRLAALTTTLAYDTRDNFFTPTRGWRVDLTVPVFRSWLGGDRDFEKANLTATWYHPLAETVFFGIRATGKASSGGTPFYLRPYVVLRGVQALQYQGEQAAETEAELRWQFHPRFSLVAFGGAGIARSDLVGGDDERTVGAGGAGFRYLMARTYGLHMGMDIAFGPDDPAIYVIFGGAWTRP